MTPLSAFLNFVLPALLIACAAMAMGLLPGARSAGTPEDRPTDPTILRRLLPPLLVALAFFPADVALNQWHALWPTDGTRRFLAVVLGAAVAGALHGASDMRPVTVVLRAALGAGLALAVLGPLPEQYMPPALLVGLIIASALWLAAAGAALDAADARLPRPAVPAALAAAALVAAPGLFESGYAGGATLAGALGAIAGGLCVARLARGRLAASLPGAWTVWLALLGSILLVTYGYQDVPASWALALMALAPFGALAGLAAKRSWLRALLALLGAAFVAGGATVAVLVSITEDGDEPSYGY